MAMKQLSPEEFEALSHELRDFAGADVAYTVDLNFAGSEMHLSNFFYLVV